MIITTLNLNTNLYYNKIKNYKIMGKHYSPRNIILKTFNTINTNRNVILSIIQLLQYIITFN